MRKTVLIVLAFSLTFLLVACDVKTPSSEEDYAGKQYSKVRAELEESGFKNIKSNIIEDLTSDGPMEDETVESVSINENDSFKQGDKFEKDSEVQITYHVIKKLAPPVSSDDLQDKDYKQLGEMFINSGFANVIITEEYDLDPEQTDDEYVNEVVIGEKSTFSKEDQFPFDANVMVICHYPYIEYNAEIKIDFVGNLFLSKYDVVFSIEDKELGTHRHGEGWKEDLSIREGERKLHFVNVEDSSITGEATLDVTSNLEAEYEITCHSDKIAVKEKYVDRNIELSENQTKVMCSEASFLSVKYKDVEKELKDMGFVNIKSKPVYDIDFFTSFKGDTKSVTINGSRDYRRGDVFEKDTEIKLVYHMLVEDDPAIKEAAEKGKRERKEIKDSVVNKSCVEAREHLKEKGYKASYIFEMSGQDYTKYINTGSKKEINKYGYIVTGIDSIDTESKSIQLAINTKSNIKEIKKQKKKEKKLSDYITKEEALSALWVKVKNYYPGAKRREILAQRAVDNKTWFIKFYVEYEGEIYNCEGYVEGPGDSPSISGIKIY